MNRNDLTPTDLAGLELAAEERARLESWREYEEWNPAGIEGAAIVLFVLVIVIGVFGMLFLAFK